MAKPADPPLNACDVLNWEYLIKIAAEYDPDITEPTLFEALAKLAYDLTQSGDENIRNQQLNEFLHLLTDRTSTDSTEQMLELLAKHLRCDIHKMRQFAKENGIKLKKLRLW